MACSPVTRAPTSPPLSGVLQDTQAGDVQLVSATSDVGQREPHEAQAKHTLVRAARQGLCREKLPRYVVVVVVCPRGGRPGMLS